MTCNHLFFTRWKIWLSHMPLRLRWVLSQLRIQGTISRTNQFSEIWFTCWLVCNHIYFTLFENFSAHSIFDITSSHRTSVLAHASVLLFCYGEILILTLKISVKSNHIIITFIGSKTFTLTQKHVPGAFAHCFHLKLYSVYADSASQLAKLENM